MRKHLTLALGLIGLLSLPACAPYHQESRPPYPQAARPPAYGGPPVFFVPRRREQPNEFPGN